MHFFLAQYYYYCLLLTVFSLLVMYLRQLIVDRALNAESRYITGIMGNYKGDFIKAVNAVQMHQKRNSLLRRILAKGLKYDHKAMGKKPGQVLVDYIDYSLKSSIVEIVNMGLLICHGKAIPSGFKSLITKLSLEKENSIREHDKNARNLLLKLFFMKSILLIVNSYFYLRNPCENSYQILIGVDLVGFILQFAFIFDIKSRKKEFKNARNLAYTKWLISMQMLISDNSIANAIIESYKDADMSIKSAIKPLVADVKAGREIDPSLETLIKTFNSPELITILRLMPDNEDEAFEEIGKYYIKKQNQERSKEIIKTKANTTILTRCYEIVASLGLMINVSWQLLDLINMNLL